MKLPNCVCVVQVRDLLLWKDVYVGEGEEGYATLTTQESSPPGGTREKSRDSSAEEQDTKCQVPTYHSINQF